MQRAYETLGFSYPSSEDIPTLQHPLYFEFIYFRLKPAG